MLTCIPAISRFAASDVWHRLTCDVAQIHGLAWPFFGIKLRARDLFLTDDAVQRGVPRDADRESWGKRAASCTRPASVFPQSCSII